MWAVTWRGLAAHKLRFVLTMLAIVLGVAFVAGSFMLTDTIERSFTSVITETAGGVDLRIRPADSEADFADGFGGQQAAVEAGVLDAVAAVDGVEAASPEVTGTAQILDAEGRPIGGMGPPTLGVNVPADPRIGSIDVRDGRLPEASGEVAIDAYTARTQEFAVGDTVRYVAGGPVEEAALVGIVGFGEADNLAGATVTLFDFETALDKFSPDGAYASVEALVAAGADRDEVAERVAAAVGADYEVVTADTLIEENTEAVAQFLGIFSTALLVFAAVALFVGVFIIYNTFSIVGAQRVRELALLRAVGAARAQVLRSVLGEAAIVGLVGSVVGIAAGALLAVGLKAMLAAFDVALPTDGLVFQARTAVVAVVVGFVVTLASAVGPALRATRIAPVQALQAIAAPPRPRRRWLRTAAGAVLTAAGVALLAAGLFADAGLAAVGAGAAAVFLGIALLSPLVARPLTRVLGLPVAKGLGVRGDLARENAMRNPRRTASTASALMIGVGLVGFVTIFAASMTQSIGDAVDDVYRLDFDVRSTTFQPISADIADALADVDDVDQAIAQRLASFRIGEDNRFLIAAETDELAALYDIDMVEGAMSDLGDGGVLVSESAADRDGLAVGDTLEAHFPAGPTELSVDGVYDGRSIDVDYVTNLATYRDHVRSEQVFAVGVVLADAVDPVSAQAAIDDALVPYPTVRAMDRTAVKAQITGQINQLLGLVYGLLALSVVIAFFGIVNTLALSVFERIREIGLLRAVGMTRSQVRSMVRWESMLVAVLGAVLGLGIGLFFGWILVQALQEQFELRYVVPAAQLAAAVVAAAGAGVLAGALPARRAARVDMLRAVTIE